MTFRLRCALANLEHGALIRTPDEPLTLHRGHYDFARLHQLMAGADQDGADGPPHIIGINEAKHWELDRQRGLNFAAEVLSTTLGRPYIGLMGWLGQGFAYPALFFDPTELTLESWGDTSEPALNKRNLAVFRLRHQPSVKFQVFIDHWPYWSGHARLERAKFVCRPGVRPEPTLFIGDLNGTASGPHLPQRDWNAPGIRKRFEKGKQLIDGRWVADTDALDFMIGTWNPHLNNGHGGGRDSEQGWHAVEEAHGVTGPHAENALLPTVNPKVDSGGPLLIDWALYNDAWRGGVVAGSVHVAVPEEGAPYASDHRRKTWTMELG